MRTAHAELARLVVALALSSAAETFPAQQNYPIKPVRMISQAAAGSAADVVTRVIGDQLAKAWGQMVVVDNRPGGGGVVAAQATAKAPPDGYTLFAVAASAFVIAPVAHQPVSYDPERDFAPIGFVSEIPLVIGIANSIPAHTVPELIALASREPGKLQYGANQPGSFPNLAAELFASRANIRITFVPYKGIVAALHDLMGGRLSMVVEGVAGLTGHLRSGAVRPIAVTSIRRLSNFPEVPSVSETLSGFEAVGWFAIVAPAGTPGPLVRKVSKDLRVALEQFPVKSRLEDLGSYTRSMSPEELAVYIHREREKWSPIVRQLKFGPQ